MRLGTSADYLSVYGLREGARIMKEQGYDCVDYRGFVSPKGELFSLSPEERARRLKETKELLEESGLSVFQSHAPFSFPTKDVTESGREESFAENLITLEGSRLLGAKCVAIHPVMPFGPGSAEEPERVWEINADYMGRLCNAAREYELTVCLENMPFRDFPLNTLDRVVDFVKAADFDNLKICFDTGHHLVRGGSLADGVRMIGGGLLACVHVHDNDRTRDAHDVPGTGVGDFTAFTDALREIGFAGVLSLEVNTFREREAWEQRVFEEKLARIGLCLAGKQKCL